MYYAIVNINPFMLGLNKRVAHVHWEIFIRYFAVGGIFLIIVSKAKRSKSNRRNES